MGANQDNSKENELYTGHKPIPISLANKVIKSICKITIKGKENEGVLYGTGFFMKIDD